MSITFSNTVFPAGYVGEDDGAVNSRNPKFQPDDVSTGTITVSGTVTKVGDTIQVKGLLPGSDDTGITATTNTLVATQYDNSSQIVFYTTDGAYKFLFSNTSNSALVIGNNYTVASDPALVSGSGTDVYTVCFARGTHIRTTTGETPVEKLSVGDLVITASGEHRPIRWIGTRSYAGRFANRNASVLPVCFKAGSLGDDLPIRDLWVSPKHAMFIDGVLVPAECLVNGVSVIKALRVEKVDYYHVELDSHDVILAEGAPSESFIDDNGRQVFHNAAEHAKLYPDTPRKDAVYCAPRLKEGAELEVIRRKTNARAGVSRDVA